MRSEKIIDKESRHKLAPIALGPYLLKHVDDNAKNTVIVYDDKTVENVSRFRILLATKRLSSAELQSVVQPTVVNRTIENYTAAEAVNLNHVLSKDDVNAKKRTVNETSAHSAHDDQRMDEKSIETDKFYIDNICLLYTSPSPRDQRGSRMPSSA